MFSDGFRYHRNLIRQNFNLLIRLRIHSQHEHKIFYFVGIRSPAANASFLIGHTLAARLVVLSTSFRTNLHGTMVMTVWEAFAKLADKSMRHVFRTVRKNCNSNLGVESIGSENAKLLRELCNEKPKYRFVLYENFKTFSEPQIDMLDSWRKGYNKLKDYQWIVNLPESKDTVDFSSILRDAVEEEEEHMAEEDVDRISVDKGESPADLRKPESGAVKEKEDGDLDVSSTIMKLTKFIKKLKRVRMDDTNAKKAILRHTLIISG